MLDQPYSPHQLITTKELSRYLGVTVNCIERWRCAGKGPKPTYLSRRCVRYLWADVLHWLATGGGRDFPSRMLTARLQNEADVHVEIAKARRPA